MRSGSALIQPIEPSPVNQQAERPKGHPLLAGQRDRVQPLDHLMFPSADGDGPGSPAVILGLTTGT